MTAPFTTGDFSYVLGDLLSAPIPCKHEVNGYMLRHAPSRHQAYSFVFRAREASPDPDDLVHFRRDDPSVPLRGPFGPPLSLFYRFMQGEFIGYRFLSYSA